MRALILAAALLATPAAAQTPAAEPQDAAAWRAAALADLDAIRAELNENSPIGRDTQNPALTAWLGDGHPKARALAERAADKAGWYYALNFYVNGFRDPHVTLNARTSLPAARWPGFIAAPGGGVAVVVDSEVPAIPAGAEILGCDGTDLAALLEMKVYPFTLNPALALDRRRAPSRLFLDRGVPFAAPPQRCMFRTGHDLVEHTLDWRALPAPPEPYWTRYAAANAGAGADWGVSEPEPGVHWIGIPTFSSGEETAPKLQALVSAITAKAARMRADSAIVIDLRGNGGGNTAWSDRIVAALFPSEVLARHRAPMSPAGIDWRASPANIAYIRTTRDEFATEFGARSAEVRHLENVLAGLERAHARGRPFWREGSPVAGGGGGLTKKRPTGPGVIPAKVLVLSNGTCASTCLNFLDRVLFIPGVKLVGSDSGADTAMMEVRTQTLPSGLADLVIPQKVYRGRARGPLEAYAADIPYQGRWDDASVRAWVLELARR